MSRPRPKGIRLTPKLNVNTGQISRRAIFAGSLGEGDKNCAMCSAAGVVNLALGRDLWSTGMVAQAKGTGDHKHAMGDSVDDQIKGIINFCEPMSGRFSQTLGSMNKEVADNVALAFMKSFPDGTVFAINLSGGKASGDGRGICHWLNGVLQGGSVEYVDYQASHAARMNQTARSNVPILGITGETIDSPKMVVIAFPPA